MKAATCDGEAKELRRRLTKAEERYSAIKRNPGLSRSYWSEIYNLHAEILNLKYKLGLL